MRDKSAFQTIAIGFYKQPKEKQKRTPIISNRLYQVVVVAKTDVYVLRTMKIYSYFSLFSLLYQRRSYC